VEIVPLSSKINDVQFKLLTTKQAYDIENYRAPSTKGRNTHMDIQEEEEEEESLVHHKSKPKTNATSRETNKENLENYNKRASHEISAV